MLVRTTGLRVDVQGAIPTGPVLFVANHRSYVDIPVLLAHVPCVFLAKDEVRDWPFLGRAAALNSTVFFDRRDPESRRGARERSLAVLRQGLSFAAFPEGTTHRRPGIKDFFPGLFEVAAEHGLAVVPVAIEYDDPDDAWIDDDTFLRHFVAQFAKPLTKVSLHFGPRLTGTAGSVKETAEHWIRATLAENSARAGKLAEQPPTVSDVEQAEGGQAYAAKSAA